MEINSEKDFISWATKHNVKINEKIDVFSHFEKTGRGVKALSAIPKGEILAEIPPSAYIIPATLILDWKDESSQPSMISVLKEKKLSNWMTLAIQLLYLMSNGDKEGEFFQNWLSTLPSTFNTPLYFTDDERKQLAGTSVEHLLDVKMVEDNFKKIVVPIAETYPDLWNPKVCTIENFKRAATIIMSRGFHTKEGSGPFLVSDTISYHLRSSDSSCRSFQSQFSSQCRVNY